MSELPRRRPAAGSPLVERALRLTSAYAREVASAYTSADELNEVERALTPIRQALGEERVAALRAEGQAMTLEQAIDYALEDEATDLATTC